MPGYIRRRHFGDLPNSKAIFQAPGGEGLKADMTSTAMHVC